MVTQANHDVSELKLNFDRVRDESAKAVVDQEQFVEHLMIAAIAGGHCLAEGPPGVARSLTARSMAQICGLQFNRIRCTPDLLPQELIGAGPHPDDAGDISLVPGPLFAHIILVDDIRRLSPMTNSLVQQVIEGGTVVVDGCKYDLPQPNLLLATNYVDEEPPDAVPRPQDDRFMLKLALPYPRYETEYRVAESLTQAGDQQLKRVLSPEHFMGYRQTVLGVEAPPPVLHYSVRLARATRVHDGETPDFVYEWVRTGAGPRAVHFLTLAAKVRAALHGRAVVESDDIRQVSHAVLRHRIVLNQNALTNGVSVDRVIDRLLYEVPARQPGDDQPPSE